MKKIALLLFAAVLIFSCETTTKKEVIPTLNRRIVLPIYIPIISLISCLLLVNTKKVTFL